MIDIDDRASEQRTPLGPEDLRRLAAFFLTTVLLEGALWEVGAFAWQSSFFLTSTLMRLFEIWTLFVLAVFVISVLPPILALPLTLRRAGIRYYLAAAAGAHAAFWFVGGCLVAAYLLPDPLLGTPGRYRVPDWYAPEGVLITLAAAGIVYASLYLLLGRGRSGKDPDSWRVVLGLLGLAYAVRAELLLAMQLRLGLDMQAGISYFFPFLWGVLWPVSALGAAAAVAAVLYREANKVPPRE